MEFNHHVEFLNFTPGGT